MNPSQKLADEFCDPALQKTFQVLATTANTCADATLIAALDSPSAEIVAAAAKSLLIRKSEPGKEAIIEHWDSLKGLLAPVFDQFPGRMVDCLSKHLASTEPVIGRKALGVAVDISEFDFIVQLLPLVENRRSPLHKDADATLTSLVQLLYDETHGKRSYAKKRDPQLARARVVTELENSLGRFDQHRSQAILISFLMLAGRDNAHVVRLLSLVDAGGLVQQETTKLLRTSSVPGVMRLLASFLDDPHAPLSALQIAASRKDGGFAEECLRKIEIGDRTQLAQNLKKVANWQWLSLSEEAWKALYESEQSAAVTWAMLSGISLAKKFEILRWIMGNGRVGARVRAAEALADFSGDEANNLLLEHLDDSDPRVRSVLLGQLRTREIPGAVIKLIAGLNDRDEQVRKVAQKHLPEFRFRRYADLFDSMEPAMQRTNGRIVKRVDPDWRQLLEVELKSEMRLRKLRGLRMAHCMEAGDVVYTAVLPYVRDEEALARQEAIEVLRQSRAPEALEAIRQCLLDEHVIVRRAAEEALRDRAENSNTPVPTLPSDFNFSTPSVNA